MPELMEKVQSGEITGTQKLKKPELSISGINNRLICILNTMLLMVFIYASPSKAQIFISGSVINDLLEYQPYAIVDFFPVWDKSTVKYSVQTDISGNFGLNMEDGEYYVRVTSNIYQVQWFSSHGNTVYPEYTIYIEPTSNSSLLFEISSAPVNNPPSSVIGVTILDSSGLLLSGTSVSVELFREMDFEMVRYGYIGSDPGKVTLDSVQPGRYALYIMAYPYPGQFYDTLRNSTFPDYFFEIDSFQNISIQVQLTNNPRSNASIRGKCFTDAGLPASGISVLLYHPHDTLNPVNVIVTDVLGFFTFDNIAEGEYYLKIAGDNYPVQWFSNTMTQTTLYPAGVVYASSYLFDTLSIALSTSPLDNTPSSLVKVIVYDQYGSKVQTSGVVEIIESYKRLPRSLAFESVNMVYSATNIAAGEYAIKLDIPGYPIQFHSDNGNTVYETSSVYIGLRDTILIETYLLANLGTFDTTHTYGFVSITVQDSSGSVTDAIIDILDPSGFKINSGITDAKGRTVPLRVPALRHSLSVDAQGYPLQYWSNDGPTANITSVNDFFVPVDDTLFLNLTLMVVPPIISDTITRPNLKSTLRGYVFNSTGMPVYRARVVLLPPDFGYDGFNPKYVWSQYENFTDAVGMYSFQAISPGSYIIMAEADSQNYVVQFFNKSDLPTSAQQVNISDSSFLVNTDFTLRTGGILKGSITTAQGQGIEGVRVYINEIVQNGRSYEVVSGADGSFQASGIPGGNWNVYAVHSQYLPADSYYDNQYTVTEGNVTTTTFLMEAGGRVSGPVTSSLPVDSITGDLFWGTLFLFNNSSVNSDSILRPEEYTDVRLELPTATTTLSGTYVSEVSKGGNWRMIFAPYPRSWDMTITNVPQPIRGLGWNYIGGGATFLSAPVVAITSLDTVKNIPLTLRKGYSVFGRVVENGTQIPQNSHVVAYVKQDGLFIKVSQGVSLEGGIFELPGLVENEEYFIEISAQDYQNQFWVPGGTNTIHPSQPYIFNMSNFIPINIGLIENPSGGSVELSGPITLWIKGDTSVPVLSWAYDNSLAIDTFKVYAHDRFGKVALLKTMPSSLVNSYTYTDTRTLQLWSEYVIVGKGRELLVRSNTQWFDPYNSAQVSKPLWLDVNKMRWGVQVDWGTSDTFMVSNQDSVDIYRKIGLEPWKMLSRRPVFEGSMTDDQWSKSDSGKIFAYKVEILSKALSSDSKSIRLDAAFFAQLSKILLVGQYEYYKTIQQAINAASEFDEIQVRAGIYRENLDLKGKNIRINGQWEYGKPPVLDASGGVAINVPFTAAVANQESPSICDFKIQNASTGISARCNVQIEQCLFYNVIKAIDLSTDTSAFSQAILTNPFLSTKNLASIDQCTFVAATQGNIVLSAASAGLAERASLAGSYIGESEYFLKPMVSLSTVAHIRNSLIVYYYSRGGFSSIPIILAGTSSFASLDNCSFWQSSITPPSLNVNLENKALTYDPKFTDSEFYFTPDGWLLKMAGIGYDASDDSYGQIKERPSAVNNLLTRVLGLNAIGLQWDRAPLAQSVAYYRIYRIPGDTTLFYVNQNSQWDLKIARDSIYTVVDTFSTRKDYFIDTTITLGKPYIYVVAAIDSNGNEGEVNVPYPPSISSYIVNSYPYKFKMAGSKWHMISAWGAAALKLTPSGSRVVYGWDNKSAGDKLYSHYIPVNELYPGKGYWFRSDLDTIIQVSSATLSNLKSIQDTMRCVLTKRISGWNQISSPFPFPVNPSWLSVLPAWEWNSDSLGYSRAYELKPWKAYWVNVLKDTIVPFRDKAWPVASTTLLAKRTAGASWELRLSLRGQKIWDTENILGVIPPALARSVNAEQLEPPPAFGASQVFFVKSTNSGDPDQRLSYQYKYATSVPSERLEWTVGISPSDIPATLEIQNLNSLPENVFAFWIGKNSIVNLRENNSVAVAPHSDVVYGYVVVTTDIKEISLFTNRFALRTPFPNPFRGSTVIEFTLPYEWLENGIRLDGKGRRVRLDVFDIAGRRVRTLVNRDIGFGVHRIIWDGSNDRVQTVPGGLYIIRLKFGKFTKTVNVFKLR